MRSKTLCVPGYTLHADYEIFEDGRILNRTTGKWIQGTSVTHTNRYVKAHLGLAGEVRGKRPPSKFFALHRLVALHFCENPHGYTEVNHKDGNRRNNAASNLEWCAHHHNMREAYRLGIKSNRGELNPWRKLDDYTVGKIKHLHRLGYTDKQICAILQLPTKPSAVKSIRLGHTWTHVA